jgi:hypothetical protein
MGLFKILVVLGLASASSFSFSQEEVTKGNQRFPFQPPAWFVRMASTPRVVYSELDSFIVAEYQPTGSAFKPVSSGIKYPCKPYNENGVIKWQFCDM